VVDKVSWIAWILNEPLHGVFSEEFPVRLRHPPENLAIELARRRRGEKVHLTVENIEDFVQTS